MLWVDQDFLTKDELVTLSQQADRIDTIEGIAIDGVTGVIRRAIDECGGALRSRFTSLGSSVVGHAGDLTEAHVAAVLNTGSDSLARRRALVQVVADRLDGSWSEIQFWVGATAIYMFYRSAVHRTTDDQRYADLMVFWDGEKKKALRRLQQTGVPIVNTPLACPGAIREVGAGSFGSSSVSGGAGGSLSAVAHFVAVTYTGNSYISPTLRRNAESHPSAVVSVTPPGSGKIIVDISALSQADPTAQAGLSEWANRITPTGWNVYAGLSVDDLRLQNVNAPLVLETSQYEILSLETATPQVLRGQAPDSFVPIPDQVRHG